MHIKLAQLMQPKYIHILNSMGPYRPLRRLKKSQKLVKTQPHMLENVSAKSEVNRNQTKKTCTKEAYNQEAVRRFPSRSPGRLTLRAREVTQLGESLVAKS